MDKANNPSNASNATEQRHARMIALRKMERAGLTIRFYAWFLDTFLLSLVIGPLALVNFILVSMLDHPTLASMVQAAFQVVYIGIYVAYHSFFLAKTGASPGMQYNRIRVIDLETVQYPTLTKAIIRTVGTFASAAIFGIGFLTIAFLKDKQGLHDIIAKSVVVKLPPMKTYL